MSALSDSQTKRVLTYGAGLMSEEERMGALNWLRTVSKEGR